MKILLGDLKNSERQHSRARSFSFWREFPDVCLHTSPVHTGWSRTLWLPLAKTRSGDEIRLPQSELLSLCSQSFSIYYLFHYSHSFWNFRLFIIHPRIFDYSLFPKATTPLFISIFPSLGHPNKMFRFPSPSTRKVGSVGQLDAKKIIKK